MEIEKQDKKNYLNIDILKDDMNYWFVRTNGGKWFNEFIYENHCTIIDPIIDFEKLESLETYMEFHSELTKTNDQNIERIKTREKQQKKTDEEIEKILVEETLSKRSITIEAKRLFNFVNGIKINDLIIIPSKSSRNYKIGLVASEVKEYSTEDLKKIESRSVIYEDEKKYIKFHPSNNKLYREITWLKTLKRKEVDAEILNHLNMHQAVANLDIFKYQLNHLLSPIYIQNNKLHINIKVAREEGIDNDLWLKFHKSLKNIENISEAKVDEVKVDVQSPGYIELISQVDPQLIKDIFNGAISVVKPVGFIGLGIVVGNIFNGKEIKKFYGVEFTEKVPKEVKEEQDEEAKIKARVNRKKLEIEERELDKKIEKLTSIDVDESLKTTIELTQSTEIKNEN